MHNIIPTDVCENKFLFGIFLLFSDASHLVMKIDLSPHSVRVFKADLFLTNFGCKDNEISVFIVEIAQFIFFLTLFCLF